jgi:hypothetical protein
MIFKSIAETTAARRPQAGSANTVRPAIRIASKIASSLAD